MPSLTDLIHVIPPDVEDETEDIFASARGLMYPGDVDNHHGSPDSTLIYRSPKFGNIELKTADPQGEEQRRLFSHYLWNSGILLASLISDVKEKKWSVEGETVLELGAGTGLVGIVATLADAQKVTISDYPAPVVLDNIRRNATRAIPAHLQTKYQICGHEWGDFDSEFAHQYKHSFTCVLMADCLWMPSQHVNLVRSLLHFLALEAESRILAIAGFHTGRAKLAAFFDVAVEEGLGIDEIYEEDTEGKKRSWQKERDGGREDVAERKKWMVVARMRRERPMD